MILVLAYQALAPLCAMAVAHSFGLLGTLPAAALILMLAAPSLTGSPNFLILLGHDPAPALRLLLLGTAVLPVTAVPVLSLIPDLVSPEETQAAALRLAAVIFGTVALAFCARAIMGDQRATRWQTQIDGLSALLLAVLVVGLMTAVGPGLREAPLEVFAWMAFAFAVNFGLQLLAWTSLGWLPGPEHATAAFVAGNRNIALFLVALPAGATDKLLMFIGCYQIPMYLTPLLLGWLYTQNKSVTPPSD